MKRIPIAGAVLLVVLGTGSSVSTRIGSGSASPGAITLLAYWGVIGGAGDRFSSICILFCGANGNQVFNRIYSGKSPSHMTDVPAPHYSLSDRISACESAVAVSNGPNGATDPHPPNQMAAYSGGGNYGNRELNPEGLAFGEALGGATAIGGAVSSCVGESYKIVP